MDAPAARGNDMNTKLLKSMLVIAAMGIAGSAHASYTYLNTVSAAPKLNVGDFADFSASPAIGSFSDVFTFDLLTASGASAVGVTLNGGVYDISGLNVALYAATSNGFVGVPSGASLGSAANGVTFIVSPLVAGLYDLVFTGVADGSNGGHFLGSVTAVAAVPLPAAAWLLLSGLVGVGAMARRGKIRKIDA
jgi:hypothetical protein